MSKKIKLETLYNRISKAVGENYCWFDDYSDAKTVDIQVGDWAEDDAREIIEDAGYEIIDDSWFSGSSFDGVVLTINR